MRSGKLLQYWYFSSYLHTRTSSLFQVIFLIWTLQNITENIPIYFIEHTKQAWSAIINKIKGLYFLQLEFQWHFIIFVGNYKFLLPLISYGDLVISQFFRKNCCFRHGA